MSVIFENRDVAFRVALCVLVHGAWTRGDERKSLGPWDPVPPLISGVPRAGGMRVGQTSGSFGPKDPT